MTRAEFIAIWNSSKNAIEFGLRTGLSVRGACVRAYRLRAEGHEVKRMPSAIAKPFESRFWSMVLKTDSCWNWTGCANRRGYGTISTKRGSRPLQAHRVSYEIHFGTIPVNQCVLHKCDNPRCVNPSHLFLGTPKNNTDDMIQKERGHWQRNAPSRQQAKRDLADL